MKICVALISLFLIVVVVANGHNVLDENARSGRVNSLFNVIYFKNEACNTEEVIGGGTVLRQGTCYRRSECGDRGGRASGNCAAGFGVCCLFTLSTSAGGTVRQNCTYIQNPGFPSAVTAGTNTVRYTLEKCASNVCFHRLDFQQFTLNGPATPAEVNGGECSIDSLTVTQPTGGNIPTICGRNTGQHIYVDVGEQEGATATLNFAFTGANANRIYDIKVTQIPCGARYAPPDGCLQYFTGVTGQISTFNFLDATGNHLANQDYTACIRPERGFCCVEYTVCRATNAFSLWPLVQAAGQNNFCVLDYISIQGASPSCNQGNNNRAIDSRFCGGRLSNTLGAPTNTAVCDCTPPFAVSVFTDNRDDNGAMAGGRGIASRGVCLDYRQIPCTA